MNLATELGKDKHLAGLSHDQLRLFAAGIAGLSSDEIQKAKILYLRNSIASYQASLEMSGSFKPIQLLFSWIPIFWPFINSQKKTIQTSNALFETQIRNAVDVWKDDLNGETFQLPSGEVIP